MSTLFSLVGDISSSHENSVSTTKIVFISYLCYLFIFVSIIKFTNLTLLIHVPYVCYMYFEKIYTPLKIIFCLELAGLSFNSYMHVKVCLGNLIFCDFVIAKFCGLNTIFQENN